MLTIVTQPDAVNLSKNPILFQFSTNNYQTSAGTKELHGFYFTSVMGNSDTLTFTFPNLGIGPLVFSRVATLTGTGLEFTNAQADPDDFAELELYPALLSNYLLTKYYDITFTTGANTIITITAKEPGTLYAFTPTFSDVSDIVLSGGVTGANAAYRSNFKALLQLFVEQEYLSDEFIQEPMEIEADPDADFNLEANLASIIDTYLRGDLPVFPQFEVTRCENVIKRCYVKYGEKYGDSIAVQGLKFSETFRALKGGLQQERLSLTNFYDEFIADGPRFLSLVPLTKKVSKLQQEFLYYLNTTNATTIKVKCIVNYADGTTDTLDSYETTTTLDEPEVFLIPVGFSNLGLDELGGDVQSYIIRLLDQDDELISEDRTYIVDNRNYPNIRYFLYRNSLGGYSTLRTTGEAVSVAKINKDTAEKFVAPGSDFKTRQQENFNTSWQLSRKANTGLVEDEYTITSMIDFLLSEDVYEIMPYGYMAVNINVKDVEFHKQGEALQSFKFEYTPSFTNTSFTQLVDELGASDYWDEDGYLSIIEE